MRNLFTTTTLVVSVLLLLVTAPARAGKISGIVKTQGLRSASNVLVYLANAPAAAADLTGAKFVMDQRNLTFIPHVLPVYAGATVHFPNNDSLSHNVFSLSRTQNFNLGSYKPGDARTVRFDRPGIVEVRCDVHAEMLAYIMVMKNPYWAVTDERGRFEIPDAKFLEQNGIKGISDLPAGSYVIKTWHEKAKAAKETVVVPKAGTLDVTINIRRGTAGVLYK